MRVYICIYIACVYIVERTDSERIKYATRVLVCFSSANAAESVAATVC